MSGVKIIRALLAADAALTALVPAVRIVAGVVPQGTALPAVAITEVSRVDINALKPGAYARSTSRVQVTVMAASYPMQKQILGAVRHACRDKVGTIAGVGGVSVLLDSTGPDFNDSDTGFYMQSQDFKVSFIEPT
ncbi:MAG: DUF3168 domain-containing protein [Rhodoferax sp.]|nr:DUF3168 domain-containing protein [Rhodoferax sp.]MDP3650902.1 DUF3168 domain-containing protein [Rhodoferax sp.]